MSLSVDIRVRLDRLNLDVTMEVPRGSVTAVLGPNGAGKSTLLRCICGVQPIDEGLIALGGRTLTQPPAVDVPAPLRRVGYVPQHHVLFPHLSALDNVAFGARARGQSRSAARTTAERLLRQFGLGELASARPSALSGGQSQRVAIARAMASEPEALVLDEPFASLDVEVRGEARIELRRWLAEFDGPTVLVTHDPIDAFSMADRLSILEGGRLSHDGTLNAVLAQPASPYAAEMIGTNLVRGSAEGTRLRVHSPTAAPPLGAEQESDSAVLTLATDHLGHVFATIAPSAISLFIERPEGSPRNLWRAQVLRIEPMGERVRVRLGGPLPLGADVTRVACAEMGLVEGSWVWAAVKATEISTYEDGPRPSG
jgi:molybdate transport system ATP-binding protein